MRNVRMLWAGSLLMGFSLMTMMQNSPIQAVLLEASFTDVGFLMGFVRNTPYVLLSPLTAVVLASVSWKAPLPFSGVLMIVSSTLMMLATDLTTVLFSQLIMGVAMFWFFPCGESLVSRSFKGTNRLKAFSLFLSAVSAGFLLGSIFSGILAYALGLKTLFSVAAITSALATILLYKSNPETEETPNSLNKPSFKTLKPILYSAPYFLILASSYSVMPGYFVYIGFTELDVGVLFFCLMLARLATSYLLSKGKPATIKPALTSLSIATAVFTLFVTLNPSQFTAYIVLLSLVGAMVSVAYVYTLYIVSEKNHEQNPVMLIGMFETLIGISFLTGPMIAGYLTDVYGFWATLLLFAALAATGGLLNLRQRV